VSALQKTLRQSRVSTWVVSTAIRARTARSGRKPKCRKYVRSATFGYQMVLNRSGRVHRRKQEPSKHRSDR